MEELYEPLVPNELIVGISGRMSYVTYKEGKKLNSERSWTNWSKNSKNPLIVKNEFSVGFKLGDVNGRWSSQASNSENLVIIHPLFNKGFELSLHRFIEIANRTTIINGVIQDEMIMDKSRDILFRDEYEKLVKEHKNKVVKENKILEKNKENKVKSYEQIPGRFYVDTKTNNEYCYLGTATVDNKLKHVYIEASAVKSIYKIATIHYGGYLPESEKTVVKRIQYPSICDVGGRSFRDIGDYRSSYHKDFYYSNRCDVMRITSSKISMSSSQNSKNIFDEYTEDDWNIVDKCYNCDNSDRVDKWGNISSYNMTLKGIKSINHFRADYIKNKQSGK